MPFILIWSDLSTRRQQLGVTDLELEWLIGFDTAMACYRWHGAIQ